MGRFNLRLRLLLACVTIAFVESLPCNSQSELTLNYSQYSTLSALYYSTRGEEWNCPENNDNYNKWNFVDCEDPCEQQWEGLNCSVSGEVSFLIQIIYPICSLPLTHSISISLV